MNRYYLYNWLLILFILLPFTGCDRSEIGENPARIRIKLTDAAIPAIKELYIDIREISLFVTDSTSVEGKWEVLEFTGGEYNLLRLMNGKTVQLVDQYFDSGKKIRKIGITLGNNNRMLTVTDKPIPLQKPPEIMEGVIIDNIDIELSPHVITSIIIDINAALSIRESNGNYFINPLARAFPEIFGGSIRGYVAPLEANPVIVIIQESDTLMSVPEADGMFYFFGLNEGPWEIHLIADPLTSYRDTIFMDTLATGQKSELTPKPIRLLYDPS